MKPTIISLIAAGIIIGGAVMLTGRSGASESAHNVSIVDGKQIIDITAKGGYSPRVSSARADMASVLRIETNGTYDCSSALTIPALHYRDYLTPSGITEIEVPPQKAGTSLQGLCAMGMKNFRINFN